MLDQKQSEIVPAVQGELPEPHFDDERTVLSARPVVPLSEVSHNTRTRRRLVFAGAVAVAILFGAASAIVIVRLQTHDRNLTEINRADDQVETATTSATAGVEATLTEAETSSSTALKETQAAASSTDLAEQKQPEKDHKQLPAAEAIKAAHTSKHATKSVKAADEQTSDLTQEPAGEGGNEGLSPAERREIHRARRVERMEDRRRVNRDENGDLFRIRDIFEGVRRRRSPY